MPKQDIQKLIKWRDATADNWGDELISKILCHLNDREVPEEHQAAQREFKRMHYALQYNLIAETVGETGDPSLTRAEFEADPGIDGLGIALNPLGIFVYEDPYYKGSDSFGLVFSQIELTDEDLALIGQEPPE